MHTRGFPRDSPYKAAGLFGLLLVQREGARRHHVVEAVAVQRVVVHPHALQVQIHGGELEFRVVCELVTDAIVLSNTLSGDPHNATVSSDRSKYPFYNWYDAYVYIVSPFLYEMK